LMSENLSARFVLFMFHHGFAAALPAESTTKEKRGGQRPPLNMMTEGT
jgi:hypothetical protein